MFNGISRLWSGATTGWVQGKQASEEGVQQSKGNSTCQFCVLVGKHKMAYAEHPSLQPKGTRWALSSVCEAVVEDDICVRYSVAPAKLVKRLGNVEVV